jgi:hypothetical protein
MLTSLEGIRRKLGARLKVLDAAFDRRIVVPSTRRMVDRFALQEGLVSALWQAWCVFCRQTLIGSAAGIVGGSGQQVTSPYAGRAEMEIAYVARELSQGRVANAIRPLQGSHLEPTWGDLKKANLIAAGIASTNQANLVSAFGVGLAVSDLQMCRNASAHLNKDLISNVVAARVRYSDTRFLHPSDMMFWVDPATKDFVWKTWIDEMTIMSEFASA